MVRAGVGVLRTRWTTLIAGSMVLLLSTAGLAAAAAPSHDSTPTLPAWLTGSQSQGLGHTRDALAILEDRLTDDATPGTLALTSHQDLQLSAAVSEILRDALPSIEAATDVLEAIHPNLQVPDRFDGHASPSAAAAAVLALADMDASEHRAELEQLDSLRPRLASALTGALDAYIYYHQATQDAFANVNWPDLPNKLGAMEASIEELASLSPESRGALPELGPGALDVDVDRIIEAYVYNLRAYKTLMSIINGDDETYPLLPERPEPDPNEWRAPLIELPPALIIDPEGWSTTYRHHALLTIDVGGHDHYFNSAGGGRSPWADNGCEPTGEYPTSAVWAGMAIDLAGDDTYHESGYGNYGKCGKNGGAYLGAGFLLDVGGHDRFDGFTHGVNGGGTTGGVGFLAAINPLLETDTFSARNGGTMGGARLGGMGHLINLGGHSDYQGPIGYTTGGVIGGAQAQGIGFLIDSWGNDRYEAFGLGAIGGGDAQSRGFLMDLEGDDTYRAGSSGVNGGGYRFATGFLYDGGGDDLYEAQGHGSNGGARTHAVGLLLDTSGNDRYLDADEGGNGGGAAGGLGHLIDLAGHDYYEANRWGVNGGGFATGAGFLLDEAGNDEYVATGLIGTNGAADARPYCDRVGVQATFECTFSTQLGFGGLLWDRQGTDRYREGSLYNVTDDSIFPKGATGMQWDSSEDPFEHPEPKADFLAPPRLPMGPSLDAWRHAPGMSTSSWHPPMALDHHATGQASSGQGELPSADLSDASFDRTTAAPKADPAAAPHLLEPATGAQPVLIEAPAPHDPPVTADPVGRLLRPIQDSLTGAGHTIKEVASSTMRFLRALL